MVGKLVGVLLGSLFMVACAGNRPVETLAVTVDKPLEATADMLFTRGMLCWSRNESDREGRLVQLVGVSANVASISVLNYTRENGPGDSVFSMNLSRQGDRSSLAMYENRHDCSLFKGCQTGIYTADVKRWITGDATCSSIDLPLR
ncbi:hypothetical protein [Parathalassolituus penaei]|uniref:Lipoprotein n=1 Tax=Parathalassolituus penaei TaxID=2997323 RepID=A0A9X3EBH7_9GAMM|nr:hypothetical protein [Parathalassolituus penaei]MCY0964503.1 hypothetical protein [Parathalassolituus penaei]